MMRKIFLLFGMLFTMGLLAACSEEKEASKNETEYSEEGSVAEEENVEKEKSVFEEPKPKKEFASLEEEIQYFLDQYYEAYNKHLNGPFDKENYGRLFDMSANSLPYNNMDREEEMDIAEKIAKSKEKEQTVKSYLEFKQQAKVIEIEYFKTDTGLSYIDVFVELEETTTSLLKREGQEDYEEVTRVGHTNAVITLIRTDNEYGFVVGGIMGKIK